MKLVYNSLSMSKYYIRICGGERYFGTGNTPVKFTYPQSGSSEGTVASIRIPLKNGGTMQLGAVVSGEGKVEWSSSDKSVVTVSCSGEVIAKKKGTAEVTAKFGTSSASVTIKVTE